MSWTFCIAVCLAVAAEFAVCVVLDFNGVRVPFAAAFSAGIAAGLFGYLCELFEARR